MGQAELTPPDSRSESPSLDSTSKLTKAGIIHAQPQSTIPNAPLAPAPLTASLLTTSSAPTFRPVPARNSPEAFSNAYHTDHMLVARWTESDGWDAPEIKPFANLSISPLASVLHYATECFEGMKAYRGTDGKVRLFRPEHNAKRFVKSAERIALPGFDPEQFVELVKKFVGVEAGRWLPKVSNGEGGFEEQMIYLRPSMIATHAALGVQRPKEAVMLIVAVCFPDLDEAPKPAPSTTTANGVTNGTTDSSSSVEKENEKENEPSGPGVSGRGMKLLASAHDMIRAWPGGFGNAKVGANYGPSLVAQGEARARGYQQILWLFGSEGYVTEAGGSNFFVLWKTKSTSPDGTVTEERELVTAPLGDGVILEGITRKSVLELSRSHLAAEGVKVVERNFTMDEILQADQEGRLEEAFACGTAFFVSPVSEIHFRGKDVVLPVKKGKENEGKETSMRIKGWLKDVMYGRAESEWGVVVDEVEK